MPPASHRLPPTHALLPGSFDPPTLGHVDLVRRGARLFDRLTVALAVHPTKDALFCADERLALLEESLAGIPGVAVARIDGLVVDACRELGATVILRGVRGGGDLDGEVRMAHTNRTLHPELDTLLLCPSPEVAHLSSTLVRQVASMGGDASPFVPPPVAEALRRRFAG